jgi:DNA-directed RNA polymerase specialized sigma24 family protein
VSRSASTPPAPSEAAGPAAYEAFEQLYQATIGATTLWLYRLKVSDRDWDDAIQEIYLEAWRVWDTCDSARGTRGKWLYGITVNVASRCRERRRLKSRREEPLTDDFDAASAGPNGGDCMEINDRARFTVRFFEPISTLPLVIMIAHDMNGEPMKEIAHRHKISLAEAYRLCGRARRIFTEGYDQEQEQRRKSGALVLPFSALSLLAGPHEIPEVSPDLKAQLWTKIAQTIGKGARSADPRAPSHDALATPHGGGPLMGALRALAAHPIARSAFIFACGALTALAGERLVDALARNPRTSIPQAAPATSGAEAPIAPVANVLPASTGAAAEAPASSTTDAKPETAPGGDVTKAEAALFDVVRAAFRNPDPDKTLKAIQDYFKSYPRGYFAGACEKMRIQTLIRAGRVAEARTALDGIRKRSPKSALVKELESSLPGP